MAAGRGQEKTAMGRSFRWTTIGEVPCLPLLRWWHSMAGPVPLRVRDEPFSAQAFDTKRNGTGVDIFFTVITQIFFSIKIKKSYYFYDRFSYIINYYSLFIGVAGIILLPLIVTKIIDIPNFKNIVSWNFFFLIQLYFLLIYFGFKDRL